MFVNCENILIWIFFSRVGHWLSGTRPVDTRGVSSKPSNPPAMALCCRLSNFFRAESVNFSQVFSSRTRYLTTETWNAAGWLQREGDQRSLNGNSMGTSDTGHFCDLILDRLWKHQARDFLGHPILQPLHWFHHPCGFGAFSLTERSPG